MDIFISSFFISPLEISRNLRHDKLGFIVIGITDLINKLSRLFPLQDFHLFTEP